jgi:hypothetical protein
MNDFGSFYFVKCCIYGDNIDSLKLGIEYGVDFDEHVEYAFDKSIRKHKINTLEFILDNYTNPTLNNIPLPDIDISKYRFIKMLIDRNILDLPN